MSRQAADSEVRIRRLTVADYDAVVDVWRAAGMQVSLTGCESATAFGDQTARFPDLFLGAEHDYRLVGVVLGSHDGRKGWINRLAVRPEYRRRSIALRLVEACEQALHGHGIEIICALVERPNTASYAVFERAGYQANVPVHYFRKLTRPDV